MGRELPRWAAPWPQPPLASVVRLASDLLEGLPYGEEVEMANDFVDKLRLKESAEEDVHFARLDRELVAALRARRAQPPARTGSGPGQGSAPAEGADRPAPGAGSRHT